MGEGEVWLYVRGTESIRVTKLPLALILLIHGPGHVEDIRRFTTLAALDEFRDAHEHGLLDEGWTLHFTVERRSGDEGDKGSERHRQ
jgi:hypothetical protein